MITAQDVRTMNKEQLKVLNDLADTIVVASRKLADTIVVASRKLADTNVFETQEEIEIRLYEALYGTKDLNEINMVNLELYMRKDGHQ